MFTTQEFGDCNHCKEHWFIRFIHATLRCPAPSWIAWRRSDKETYHFATWRAAMTFVDSRLAHN